MDHKAAALPFSLHPSLSASPCAGCKFLRRKCQPECIFAPYFPPDNPRRFADVHRVFGASNVSKTLNDLRRSQREDAVNSLAYEAEMRLRDPVYGAVGYISLLQRQLRHAEVELAQIRSEVAECKAVRGAAVMIRSFAIGPSGGTPDGGSSFGGHLMRPSMAGGGGGGGGGVAAWHGKS